MKPLGFDIGDLQVFVEVAESGSMTAAAHRLGMTQPAVSHTVRRLESGLGTTLLDRHIRPLRLTTTGAVVQEHAERGLADMSALQRRLRMTDTQTVAQVSIGMIDSFSVTVGPQLIKSLQDQAEQLSMWSGISPNLESDLLRRDLDFIVTPTPLEDVTGLEHHALYQDPYLVVVHNRDRQNYDSLESLSAARDFVRYSGRSRIGEQIERHLRWLRLQPPQRLEFDGTEAVLSMVAAGLGWAITTPLCLLQVRSYLSTIRSIALPGPALDRNLYLVGRKDEFTDLQRRMIARTRSILRELINTQLSGHHKWLARHIVIH